MIKTRLRYCVYDPDPAGNSRYYVRKNGKKIRIREQLESPDGTIGRAFMDAYFSALATLDAGGEIVEPKTPREKTFNWLCDQYYRSSEFQRFDKLQADKRSVLDRFCATVGELPYAAFRKDDVERSRDKRSAKPGAADKLVKYLRALFKWAIDKKHATHNPAVGVAKINEGQGWHTWTPDEVEIYRQHHETGTKARLALELMLNVGARIDQVHAREEAENAKVGVAASLSGRYPIKADGRTVRPTIKFRPITFDGCKSFKIDPTIILDLVPRSLIPMCKQRFHWLIRVGELS